MPHKTQNDQPPTIIFYLHLRVDLDQRRLCVMFCCLVNSNMYVWHLSQSSAVWSTTTGQRSRALNLGLTELKKSHFYLRVMYLLWVETSPSVILIVIWRLHQQCRTVAWDQINSNATITMMCTSSAEVGYWEQETSYLSSPVTSCRIHWPFIRTQATCFLWWPKSIYTWCTRWVKWVIIIQCRYQHIYLCIL